jgi:glycosyltransferase involved in cell wall biosynthesis
MTSTLDGLDLILSVDPITPELTGIGRYTLELANGLIALAANKNAAAPRISELRFFWHWKQLDSISRLLEPSIVSNVAKQPDSLTHRMLRTVYSRTVPSIQALALKKLGAFTYHSPNFYLPKFKGKAISTFHDLSVTRHPEWHPKARIEHLARSMPLSLERADAIITATESVRRELVEDFGINPDSVFVVPMGVSAEWFSPSVPADSDVLAALGLEKDRYSLCVATLEPRKNIVRLLLAYSALPLADRKRWPLALCGQVGWLGEDIKKAVANAAAQGWLRYLGFVPDNNLQVLMRCARCFVFPSLYEGFGLPVLEAMASGVPVVASDISSLRELAGGAAAHPDPTNVPSIRAAIEKALCDEDWRDLSSLKGSIRAKEFSWVRTVKETMSVYATVAN